MPIFEALKPPGEYGFVHSGEVGAGHFAKMVHNGIEYAMMQAYAEGWELLEKMDIIENVTEVFDSWREEKRANSEAAMTFIGTALSMAASTVHRPSPESAA